VSGLPTLNAHDRSIKLPIAHAAHGFGRPITCNDRSVSGLACRQRHGSERTTTQVRKPGTVRSPLAGLVLLLALLGLVAPAAPTAHADAVDDTFLSALKSKGINFASPQAALLAGHEVCDELDQGRQPSDVASDVQKNSNLDGYHTGFFVGVSIAAFCPRHAQ
jgi:hypothetical protein